MKRSAYLKFATAAVFVAALAGCSSYPRQTDAQRLALYEQYAGEEVKSFRMYGASLNGWTPLGDEALAVFTKPNEAFLLTLPGRCQDLDYAPAIGLTSQFGTVYARFDKVLVYSSGPRIGNIPCRIQSIRKLDTKGLKAAQREMRKGTAVERPADDADGDAPGAAKP